MRRSVLYPMLLAIITAAQVFFYCPVLSGISFAGELPREPILKISTEMHTASIRNVATDAANRYIVTGSIDKEAKVWDFSTGELLRTLRLPIGEGDEGKIYGVAVTPDGTTVACGGDTKAGENSFQIYLFNRASGKLVKRISGQPAAIVYYLTYSKDGKYLVATLDGKSGIRVYRTSDYALVAEDKDYGDSSLYANFDNRGRLVTSCYDGFIRLYDHNFRLIKKEMLRNGKQPKGVVFSPDNTEIAVGCSDLTSIDILSGKDLTHLYSPDTTGVKRGVTLGSISWSYDGDSLYAGGRYSVQGLHKIRKWQNKGRGDWKDIPASNDTIMNIIPLKDGGIAYGSADPSFGVFNNAGERMLFKDSSTADFRSYQKGFLVSDDGSMVQFSFDTGGKSPATFSFTENLLKTGTSTNPTLKPPIVSSAGHTITDWRNTKIPKLNGVALKLKEREISRSLAIAPDGNRFLLGTEWALYLFDMNGNVKWKTSAPGVAWSVNISGNGKLGVAAFGDGTIRWYRMTDGKELLTFFPHADKKRWIVWTPKGFYSASPDGESIIGWHVNNGIDKEAHFFSVSKFRKTYYRPDVIERIFETLDEGRAIEDAEKSSGRQKGAVSINKMFPPIVSIISPADNTGVTSTRIPVKFSVQSPSGEPINDIKVLVNGRPVAAQKDIVLEETASKPVAGSGKKEIGPIGQQVTVNIPEDNSTISLIASNRYASSEPATLRLRWTGKVRKEEFVIRPKLYVLSIGIGKYVNFPAENQLKYAAKDARDFAETIKRQKNILYRDVTAKVLTDDSATRDNILDGLEWIQKQTTSKDVAMLFLSGHGINDNTGVYYFVPTNFDKNSIMRTGVPYSNIKNTVANLAGKTLVFVDTCHSGNVMGTRKALGDTTGFINELASAENGAIVFASSTGKQFSLEKPEWNNGAFTKALIEGLSGKADYTRKGKISINMLDLYLSERVKELTGGQQTPTTTKPQTIQDFPVAVTR